MEKKFCLENRRKCFVSKRNVFPLVTGILYLFVLSGLLFCPVQNGCAEKSISSGKAPEVYTYQPQIPVLKLKPDNKVLQIELKADTLKPVQVRRITVNFDGTTNINDIENIRLVYTGNTDQASGQRQFGKAEKPSERVSFNDKLTVAGETAFFDVLLTLKKSADLLGRISVSCESVQLGSKVIKPSSEKTGKGLRIGVALRQHGDDQVDTYRIPGLTTSAKGTLLAIYDVRRERSGDLQGNIDIGLSRSTDGGNTWEPMRIVLDRGEWGGLPQKFNGISDACILADKKSGAIFVAGLWMYGVLDENGKWIEGLKETSDAWNHQWRDKGSQPGFGVKQTPQFLLTKSTDDGLNWSEPVDLTTMCKKEKWWLWAPAPGHGITLDDGTLVFPTQGRDENGNPFSNITWSKDCATWHTSNFASRGTNENMVAQLSNGEIMLNARNPENRGNLTDTNGRVISVSSDLGENWITHPTSQKALVEPACMASLHRHFYTENGEKKSILLFSNPNSKTTRDHMTIKVSFDDGATWPEKYWLLLDEGKGRGYSCLTSVDEQTIGILYEGSQSDLVFQKISLEELIEK